MSKCESKSNKSNIPYPCDREKGHTGHHVHKWFEGETEYITTW